MSDPWPGRASAPSLEDIARLAEAAFESLPDLFRRAAGEIVFRVDDFPDEEILDALGLQDPFELTGLYQGVDLSRRSILDAAEPARVFLFRRPLLDEWADRGDVTLADLVSHVLIHEIGHHLGLSDEQIHRIETR
ncbi:MAG: metallopeptidase family protein [Phenylobacterium sp.]|jgi:predicted Zn-dependent protease with MMP-like domain|uniref:metallopeptidase family protein n=1 Tax=Phenylobacterium sp. TaxID=1871053 RepID=UPI0025DFA743|nr:metallopeptidase family protein [Phenylobacterium sp.]MCA3755942.1 metallopeptidase family protein [Phenylobacterium sp.]